MTDQPWPPSAVITLVWSNALAALVLISAYIGVSGTAILSRQLVWTAVAVAGLAIGGIGNASFLTAGASAVRSRIRLLPVLLGSCPGALVAERRSSGPAPTARLVAGPRMTRYHRQDCILVAGKKVRGSALHTHVAAGRRACGVCDPGEPARPAAAC